MYGWFYFEEYTLSDHGGVTRGICKVDGDNLIDIVETSNIKKTCNGAEVNGVAIPADSYVSMNMWGFPAENGKKPEYLDALEQGFVDFFNQKVDADPLKAEYLLPIHIGEMLKDNKISVKVLETNDKWFGVTYKEDKESVVQSFKKLLADGVYLEELYSDL